MSAVSPLEVDVDDLSAKNQLVATAPTAAPTAPASASAPAPLWEMLFCTVKCMGQRCNMVYVTDRGSLSRS